MNSSKRIIWSASDPGGRNAIAPVVRALRARGDEIGESVKNPELLLAGTSMGDSPDKRLLEELQVPSVYVMDFWGNYRARFSNALPTKLCVIDEQSKRDALAEGFPGGSVVVTGNPYFEHFADAVTREHEARELILFVSQPVRADVGPTYGFDEYQTLEGIIDALPEGYRLGIRLHPRDDVHKYGRYLNDRVYVTQGSLEKVLSSAGLVVGMFSPVLMQAALAGKLTVSYQPGGVRMATKRMGVGYEATTLEQLVSVMGQYASGHYNPQPVILPWRTGATGRVLAVIDALL